MHIANGHGGARPGSGKKKKALIDKILEGNPGKRTLTIMEFDDLDDLEGIEIPKVREYLTAIQKDGDKILAADIYEETWNWLYERDCINLIPKQLIEHYAMSVSRYIQCENFISYYGFLTKHPTTGNAMLSPYVTASQSFLKQANNIWYQIFQVVRENCTSEYKADNPNDSIMEKLLNSKRG